MPQQRLKVLISGAGIAGCTLAYWLGRSGHVVTVVERGLALRSSGSPVDLRGPAMRVAEAMGIVARLREAATQVDGLCFYDAAGQLTSRLDLQGLRRSLGVAHVELPRGDLAAILHEASRDDAKYRFGDTITALTQTADGAAVQFQNAPAEHFDVVVGADGLHSTVRRLAFGPEAEFVRHAGLYVATLPLPETVDIGRDLEMLSAPGRAVALLPSRGRPLALLVYWHPEIQSFDRMASAAHRQSEYTLRTFRNACPGVTESPSISSIASEAFRNSRATLPAPSAPRPDRSSASKDAT